MMNFLSRHHIGLPMPKLFGLVSAVQALSFSSLVYLWVSCPMNDGILTSIIICSDSETLSSRKALD